MPRTRSLAWSELKIGILAVVRDRPRGDDRPCRRRAGGIRLGALRAQDEVPERPGPQGRGGRPRRGGRRRQGHQRRLRGRGSADHAGGERGEQDADHRPVARVDRIAEPARRADHRDQPGDRGDAAQGRRLHPERQDPGAVRRGRRERVSGPRGGDRAHQGHPRRQGHDGPAVHRRPDVQRDERVRGRGAGSGQHDQPGPRHGRPVHQRSHRVPPRERGARQPPGDDAPDQCRRGQPRASS